MRLDLMQNLRMEQRMKLAPRMIQSMEILQLPIMALQDRLQQEIQENPALEVEGLLVDQEGAADEGGDDAAQAEAAPEPQPETATDDRDQELEWLLMRNDEMGDLFESGPKTSRGRIEDEGERKHDAMQNMASRQESLQESLLNQFSYFDSSDVVRDFGQLIIENINNDGYLGQPLDRLIATFGQPVTPEEAEDALRLVQRLEPRGVGARDLRECLLLQLDPRAPDYETLHRIIADHLEDVEHNRLPVIQRKTGLSLDAIKDAIEELAQLRFRPGSQFHEESAPRVIPDVMIDVDEQGAYQLRLNREYVPNLRISRFCLEELRKGNVDKKTKDYLQGKIQQAKWLMEAIEQRQSTLRNVAQAIVDHQRLFLERGEQYVEPLKMQQIADRVGVHVTTVSRAVGDKWIQTPRGIFPLKRFFGGGTVTADGETVAWDTVRRRLVEIINAEDKSQPLSDDELADKLAAEGFDIARRTVTKYREKLGIPKKAQRREYR